MPKKAHEKPERKTNENFVLAFVPTILFFVADKVLSLSDGFYGNGFIDKYRFAVYIKNASFHVRF